jgi:hypothetical protein
MSRPYSFYYQTNVKGQRDALNTKKKVKQPTSRSTGKVKDFNNNTVSDRWERPEEANK